MNASHQPTSVSAAVQLPEVNLKGQISTEEALMKRRSVRHYLQQPITLSHAGQLLWAAQGITESEQGRRTAASAGARYPLEIYLAARLVADLEKGLYRYDPIHHQLHPVARGSIVKELAYAARQEWMAEAAAVIAISADYSRTTIRYGERGLQYVHMDVGITAANVYLQAESLELGTVFVGAFVDREVDTILRLSANEEPLCLLPVGRPDKI